MLAARNPRSLAAGSSYLPGKLALFGGAGSDQEGLLQALAQAGAQVEAVRLSPGADPAALSACLAGVEVVLVLATELDSLSADCARLRAVATAPVLLACLLARGALPLGVAAVEQLLDSGADDVLIGVPHPSVILTRLISACRLAESRLIAERATVYRQAMAEMLDLLGGQPGGPQTTLPSLAGVGAGADDGVPLDSGAQDSARTRTFQQLLRILKDAIGWHGGALVLHEEEPNELLLVASYDGSDEARLALSGCPELRAAAAGDKPTLLASARERSLLRNLVTGKRGSEGAALWVPVPDESHKGTAPAAGPRGPGPRQGAGAGAAQGGFFLIFLCDEPRPPFDEPTWAFLKMAAQVTALGLRGKRMSEALRDKTKRVHLRRYAEERRREAVLQYREFFESSADGMMILDGKGNVLYLNRSAEQMTGYAAAGLSGRPILTFVPDNQRDGLLDAISQVIQCVSLLPFDLQLTTTSGETLVFSVSTSSVLAAHDCAVLSFRDVTEQRILEHELRKTKEFLERLIDSTVDGIIAADMYGNVILFNQGAARITGYAPEQVIGQLPVWRLYPEGEARRVMTQLRSGQHGGPGRLLQSRRTLLGKNGVAVPVSLTASIIYEEGREVATVGVVADLRERLNIEQRLAQAQELLVHSEKQALIAELAGTAAHELNQPLTSVMGYAGLLRRKLPGDNAELIEFVEVIVRESERMAELVRKIGRITRYETKPYVGESRIIDLDKSALPETSSADEPPPARETRDTPTACDAVAGYALRPPEDA